jgi:hypothetical protein
MLSTEIEIEPTYHQPNPIQNFQGYFKANAGYIEIEPKYPQPPLKEGPVVVWPG